MALGPAALIAPPLVAAPLILPGGRLERRHRSRPVLHDAFERARAPFVEVETARHRLQAHLEALHLDARARQLDDEVVNDLVVQRVELFAARVPLRALLI